MGCPLTAFSLSTIDLAQQFDVESDYPTSHTIDVMDPSIMPEHDHDFAMQKYLLLATQHEELTQHLYQMRPNARSNAWSATTTTNTSPMSTPVLAPTRSSAFGPAPMSPRRHRSHAPPPPNANSCSTSSLDTVWDEDTTYEVEAEEQRLSDVNEGIKRALTELLNCEIVRRDREFRMWVQCRLMETEQELRSGRRKRCVV